MKWIEGGVTSPRGFRASGVAAGIRKKPGRKDCALVASDEPALVAGTFTDNLIRAAPVIWSEGVCRRGSAGAAFINSGNANAATGSDGLRDAEATARLVADQLRWSPEQVCVCSTGVIGVRLPMGSIEAGVRECAATLSDAGGYDAAEAIMTTDTVPKAKAVEIELDGRRVRIGAIAKGAGMMAPRMKHATMICVITTDAVFDGAATLDRVLRDAVNQSFECVCVDNDLSTNDTVLLFANGKSGCVPLRLGEPAYRLFAEALDALCVELAKWLVQDGEGATKFVEIRIRGAASGGDAQKIARAIATSQLCKTAFFGEDANWGRIAAAAGYSGAVFDPEDLEVALDGLVLCRGGQVTDYREEDAAGIVRKPAFMIRVTVGDGPGEAVFWTSDLSHDYVSINADYRT